MARAVLLALSLLLFLLPRAALAAACTDPGYLPRFDPTLTTPKPCDEIAHATISWGGHSARLRVLRIRGSGLTTDPALADQITQAATAVGQGMSRMGGDISIDDVTVLLVGTLSPHLSGPGWEYLEGAALAMTWPPDSLDCPVSYYKERTASPGERFVQALVHEMFHCIQYKRWGGMRSDHWLVEGSAEYFVYLTRPERGPDDIQAFDAEIATRSFAGMSYQAVPFFLWLGSTGGPARVREFVFAPGPLQTTVPAATWLKFGEAYFDGAIRMPNDTSMPSTPLLGSVEIQQSRMVRLAATLPYTLNAATYRFARNRAYRLSYSSPPSGFSIRWRRLNSSTWTPAPTEVSGCSDHRVMWGGSAASRGATITVTADTASGDDACTCPIGTWQETVESTRRSEEQSGLGARGRRYISGTRILQLDGDHTGSFTYSSVESESRNNPKLRLHQVKTGGTHFTWKVVNGKLLTVLTGGNNLLTLHNELYAGGSVTVETRRAAAQSIGHDFTCDSSGLHLRGPQGHRPSYLPPGLGTPISVDMDFVPLGSGR